MPSFNNKSSNKNDKKISNKKNKLRKNKDSDSESDDELIIEAKINPNDIDNIKIGMICKIQLNAFKSKKTPKINGEISSISADILYDDFKKEFYFLARININKKQISRLKNKIDLYPGMLASVFIINDSRSFISYLFSPIYDSIYKAFREN